MIVKIENMNMERALEWNYGLVASLGQWSLEALRRYYGLPRIGVAEIRTSHAAKNLGGRIDENRQMSHSSRVCFH